MKNERYVAGPCLELKDSGGRLAGGRAGVYPESSSVATYAAALLL